MSSMSPGERVAVGQQSDIQIQAVDSPDIISSFKALLDLFLKSYGPDGLASVIHNNCGGSITLTSMSARLVNLPASKPLIKLFVTAIQEHIKFNSDGGLLAAILSLELIMKPLAVALPRRLVIDTYYLLLEECINFLESDNCSCKISISFDDIGTLLKLIRSFYTSKPSCLLFKQDLDHLCRLTLDGYVKSMNTCTGSVGTLLYISLPGKPVLESTIFTGMLFETPQIPVYRKEKLAVKAVEGIILVVLVETSMAGDSDAFMDVSYELDPGLQLADTVLEKLLGFTAELVAGGTGFLACQKVVHPKVKKLMKESGILVLDRLGRTNFNALHALAGGTVINPFSSKPVDSPSSRVGFVDHIVLHGKSYLQIRGDSRDTALATGSPVHTVLLCHRTEEALQEMKEVYKNAQHTLLMLARQPEVLYGGGCWQTVLSLHLQNQMSDLVDKWRQDIGASKTQLKEIIHQFTDTIQAPVSRLNKSDPLAHVVDVKSGHHFYVHLDVDDKSPISCQCEAVSYAKASDLVYKHLVHSMPTSVILYDEEWKVIQAKCEIFDAFGPCLNALSTAVGISSTLLGIQNCVSDPN